MRPLTITTGRHPYQVTMLAGVAGAGVTMIITGLLPVSMTSVVSTPLVLVWQIMLAAGGTAGLVGTFWFGDLDTGLVVEAGAHLMVACMLTVYLLAAVQTVSGHALAPLTLITGMAGAGWWRTFQIVRDLRRLRRAARGGHLRDMPVLMDRQP